MEMVKKSLNQYCQAKSVVVGAGVGRFLIEKIAQSISAEYKDFTQYIIPEGIGYQSNASDCAPAVALVFE